MKKLLVLMVCLLLAGSAEAGNLYDQAADLSFRFWKSETALYIRNATYASARTIMYPAWTDTSSNGDSLTWTVADSSWLMDDVAWGVYDVWYYDSGTTVQLLDNYFVGAGAISGHAFSPDTTHFLPKLWASDATITTVTFTTAAIMDWATINTASIGTAISVESGGSLCVGGTRWDDGSGYIDDDAVLIGGVTAIKDYIDAQDDVCLTQEECIGSATDPYSVSAINADLDTDEWISPIKLLSAMCFKDTTYFDTFTTADPTASKHGKLWISGASITSSVFMFPMEITSGAGPVIWPSYTVGGLEVPMEWYAVPSATETGCVYVFPGVMGTDISNDNTVTYRVLAVPPISAFGEED